MKTKISEDCLMVTGAILFIFIPFFLFCLSSCTTESEGSKVVPTYDIPNEYICESLSTFTLYEKLYPDYLSVDANNKTIEKLQTWLDSNKNLEIIDIHVVNSTYSAKSITIVYKNTDTIMDNNYVVGMSKNLNVKNYVASTQISNTGNSEDIFMYLIIYKK